MPLAREPQRGRGDVAVGLTETSEVPTDLDAGVRQRFTWRASVGTPMYMMYIYHVGWKEGHTVVEAAGQVVELHGEALDVLGLPRKDALSPDDGVLDGVADGGLDVHVSLDALADADVCFDRGRTAVGV